MNTKMINNMKRDIDKTVQGIIDLDHDEKEPDFSYPDFQAVDVWDKYKHLFVDTQLNDGLRQNNNLLLQYNQPASDDDIHKNALGQMLIKLGVNADLKANFTRQICPCRYIGISAHKDNEENAVLDILDKITYLSDRYEFKAQLARLNKIILPKDRVIICSYVHIKFDSDGHKDHDIERELLEKNILMYEGGRPLYLED